MEDLISLKTEDNRDFFENAGQHHFCFNGRQPQLFGKWQVGHIFSCDISSLHENVYWSVVLCATSFTSSFNVSNSVHMKGT